MATIESLVSELNALCKKYIAQKEGFKEFDRIREVFKAIKDQGYNISTPLFGFTMPEYELLSEEGRRDFHKLKDIQQMKMDAVTALNFERAADLRDIERDLSMKIKMDFSINNGDQPFILAGKLPELVIFNDPDNFLITLFK